MRIFIIFVLSAVCLYQRHKLRLYEEEIDYQAKLIRNGNLVKGFMFHVHGFR